MLSGLGLQPKRATQQISPKQVKIVMKLETSGHSSLPSNYPRARDPCWNSIGDNDNCIGARYSHGCQDVASLTLAVCSLTILCLFWNPKIPTTSVRVLTPCRLSFVVVSAAKLLLNSHLQCLSLPVAIYVCMCIYIYSHRDVAQAGQPCGLPGLCVALVYDPSFGLIA